MEVPEQMDLLDQKVLKELQDIRVRLDWLVSLDSEEYPDQLGRREVVAILVCQALRVQ
jgi:hypothetical protein